MSLLLMCIVSFFGGFLVAFVLFSILAVSKCREDAADNSMNKEKEGETVIAISKLGENK